MGKIALYTIQLKTMPLGSKEYHYTLSQDFFEQMESDEVMSASVNVDLTIEHTASVYRLAMDCKGFIGIPCDRCLDEMKHEVDAHYDIFIKLGDEYDDSMDDVLVIPESEGVLDVAPLIFDTVMLTVPIMHVHQSESDCNPEMMEQLRKHSAFESENDTPMSDDSGNDTAIDPRWAALKGLNDNNK